ncbi:MAG: hypothetical protein ACO4AV_14225 [bacterium]|jgi:hypothetical protein
MSANLTRFYLEPENDGTPESGMAFEDVETNEADLYEQSLQSKGIDYIRIDL